MTPRALFLVLFLPLSALAQLPKNEVALTAGWTDFSDLGGARAVGASYARFVNPWIATELGAVFAGHQIRQARGETSFTDVHATARIHAFRDSLLSPWAAVGIAYVSLDERQRSLSKIAPVAGAGLDLRLTRRLSLGAQVHHATFEVNPRDRFGLVINPTTLMLAARWRY